MAVGIRVAIGTSPRKQFIEYFGNKKGLLSATGTTRDAIDSVLDFNGQSIIIIDTAGIRRRGKVDAGIEWFSVLRAMRAIDRADIALVVIDATEPLTAQDTHITGYVEKAGKGIILLVNKWDIAPEKNKSVYNEYIESRLKFASYVPILYISAKTRVGVSKIMPMVTQIYQERAMRIPDPDIDKLVKEAVATHNLPRKGKKILKVYPPAKRAQPPTFSFS
jgi:GTP-binding protein